MTTSFQLRATSETYSEEHDVIATVHTIKRRMLVSVFHIYYCVLIDLLQIVGAKNDTSRVSDEQ